MHVIESIGPVLGIAAFIGLAVLAFLLFQQSREIRRLREWAGRAPERAPGGGRGGAGRGRGLARGGRRGVRRREAPPALGRGFERAPGGAAGANRRPAARPSIAASRWTGVTCWRSPWWRIAVAAVAHQRVRARGRRRRAASTRRRLGEADGRGAQRDLGDRARRHREQEGRQAGGLQDRTRSPTPGRASRTRWWMYLPGGRAGGARSWRAAVKPKLGETPVQAMTPDVKARGRRKATWPWLLGLDDAGFGSA